MNFETQNISEKFQTLYSNIKQIKDGLEISNVFADVPYVDKYTDSITDQTVDMLESLGYSDEDYQKLLEELKW
jgi:hypothetical protein